ncbi:unnamed protein product [Ostreobium quekettii]|uniref:U-box domain-containing protein n=1 Tax=Ostreobium quekettii TaxID=121088 RepID=A0A8S1JDF3_9CHLO|nr:unnamed protein product [Ostreobium quekettii]|eukprot:evm.model.scf_470.5 EVM.evm.TU.scf_470.5   scf_470:60263-63031(-)
MSMPVRSQLRTHRSTITTGGMHMRNSSGSLGGNSRLRGVDLAPSQDMSEFSSIGRDAVALATKMRGQQARHNQRNCRNLLGKIGSLESVLGSLIDSTSQSAKEMPMVLASMARVKAAMREAADLIARASSMGELAAFVRAPTLTEDFTLVSVWLADAVEGLEPVLSAVPHCARLKQKVDKLASGLRAMEYSSELEEQQKRQLDEMCQVMLHINTHAISRDKGTEKLADLLEGARGTIESEDVESFLDEVATGVYRARQRGNRQEEDLMETVQTAVCCHLLHQNHLQVPSDFTCPITLQIMKKPMMVVETGHTYDEEAITEWFARGRKTCPTTGVVLESMATTRNISVQRMIDDWVTENGPVTGFAWGKRDGTRVKKTPPKEPLIPTTPPEAPRKQPLQPKRQATASQEYPKSAEQPPPASTKTSLKLNHLAKWVTEEAIRSLFNKFGRITYCVVKNGAQPSSDNYGYVEFASLEQARAAIAAMNGYKMGDLKMEVKYARKT